MYWICIIFLSALITQICDGRATFMKASRNGQDRGFAKENRKTIKLLDDLHWLEVRDVERAGAALTGAFKGVHRELASYRKREEHMCKRGVNRLCVAGLNEMADVKQESLRCVAAADNEGYAERTRLMSEYIALTYQSRIRKMENKEVLSKCLKEKDKTCIEELYQKAVEHQKNSNRNATNLAEGGKRLVEKMIRDAEACFVGFTAGYQRSITRCGSDVQAEMEEKKPDEAQGAVEVDEVRDDAGDAEQVDEGEEAAGGDA